MSGRYCLCLLLTLLFFGSTFAQDTPGRKHADALYRYWCVKLPVANLVDPNSPNFLAGAERRLDKYNAFQFLAGFSVDPDRFNAKQNWYSVFNGYRVKGEYRRYFHVRRNISFYLAADVFLHRDQPLY